MGQTFEVLRVDDGGEERTVLLRKVPGGFAVEERTEGVATEVVYGTRNHEHAVLVCGDLYVFAFLQALNLDPRHALAEDVAEALRGFFGGAEAALIDLEDYLDAERVTYGYRAVAGGEVVMRPAQNTVGSCERIGESTGE